jgi:hypothetical protein
MSSKVQLIYKLENINADDGVDIFEIAPILMSFGELIRSANDVLDLDQKIDVKVKPFREGSWITEFVFHSTIVEGLLNYLNSKEGNNLLLLLTLLGVDVKTGIVSVIDVIRFTKGYVSNFHKKENINESFIYENEKGEKLTVTAPVHKLVQSPLIQNNYYYSIASPLEKFPSAKAISTQLNADGHHPQLFDEKDREFLEAYAEQELLQDVEENITDLKGIYLKPKRGSYSGEEKAYSFIMGESNILWPVSIEDALFLSQLRKGEVRPFTEDVLKVDLQIRQKKDGKNKIISSYVITHVIEYIKYEKPKQMNIEDFLN